MEQKYFLCNWPVCALTPFFCIYKIDLCIWFLKFSSQFEDWYHEQLSTHYGLIQKKFNLKLLLLLKPLRADPYKFFDIILITWVVASLWCRYKTIGGPTKELTLIVEIYCQLLCAMHVFTSWINKAKTAGTQGTHIVQLQLPYVDISRPISTNT